MRSFVSTVRVPESASKTKPEQPPPGGASAPQKRRPPKSSAKCQRVQANCTGHYTTSTINTPEPQPKDRPHPSQPSPDRALDGEKFEEITADTLPGPHFVRTWAQARDATREVGIASAGPRDARWDVGRHSGACIFSIFRVLPRPSDVA